MRVLITTCNRSIIGGIEKYLQQLIPALLETRHEIALLYEHRAPAGFELVDPPETGLPIWYWEDLTPGSRTWRELAEWEPDVVFAHGLESLGVEEVLLDRYPVGWYAHVYLGTCGTGQKCHAFPQPRPCDRRFGPMCLVLHYPRRCGGLNPIGAWRAFEKHAARNRRLKDYRNVLVASNHMYRELERHGVSPHRLKLVPLPSQHAPQDCPPVFDRLPGGSLLFAGRLTNLKGVDYLLQAMPLAERELGRKLTLTVAGDGSSRAGLELLAGRLGVAVNFRGWLGPVEKDQAMREADLLVVPSLWPEPFGMVGIEAGSHALPAVGYAVGGIPDWLIAAETGEIASGDPPTIQGLAEAIARALRDPGHYARLRRGAWELSRRFTIEKHWTALEPILEAASGRLPVEDAVAHLST
jgi:glycosyltransferase involved in cell wall biosynthesis